VQWLFFI